MKTTWKYPQPKQRLKNPRHRFSQFHIIGYVDADETDKCRCGRCLQRWRDHVYKTLTFYCRAYLGPGGEATFGHYPPEGATWISNPYGLEGCEFGFLTKGQLAAFEAVAREMQAPQWLGPAIEC